MPFLHHTKMETNSPTQPNSLSLIRSQLPALNDSEVRVAHWVLQNPNEIIQLSMAQVAQECGVSDTTVLRFCRNIGFRGYTHMKMMLAQDTARPDQIVHEDVDINDDVATLARKVFMTNIQALRDTLEVMDMEALGRAAIMIQNARRILIIGVGTSGPIVQDAHNKFFRLGLNCHGYTDSYLQLMEAALVESRDVVIGISQSGSSTDPVITMEQAKKNGASTIVITGNAQSPITRHADLTFLSPSKENRSEVIASRVAQISIIDALYVILSLRNLETSVRNERKIWDAVLAKSI
jgi:RpiR family carbohydrate utilization transcriptional regulator